MNLIEYDENKKDVLERVKIKIKKDFCSKFTIKNLILHNFNLG